MDTLTENLHNRVEELRIAKGIDSQRKLARILTERGWKVSYATISRLEKQDFGKTNIGTFLALADLFGVSLDYLVGKSDINYRGEIEETDPLTRKMDAFFAKLQDVCSDGLNVWESAHGKA